MENILELFEQTVCRCPHKKAIAYKDEAYTFAQLRAFARQIGGALSSAGMKNKPIGVIADRSIQTVAFFVGILYSGNYYVPIDPEMPNHKKQHILQDASLSVILGSAENRQALADLEYDGEYISFTEAACGEDVVLPPLSVGGEDPLYMIYTSGSTGKPKGVLKSHRAEIDYIETYRKTFSFTEKEVIGNQTPFFFDASAKDIYMMLCIGCTIEILPTTLFSFPPELIAYLNEKEVTFASWVPSVLSIVAQLNPFSLIKPTTLKRVFFVGEVMPMKHLNKWREALPDIQYVNLYGQSEIAGICCYYEVKGSFEDSQTLPIGKPLANCRIYLLDGDEIVTEPGRLGEMYIVSDALALAYFNDAEKTNQVFLCRDFGRGPERCFKTGDLFRYDSEGNLLFSSRADFQIKHMGHRIELGEIESVVSEFPQIDRCCCLYNAERKKIVLFCQPAEGVTVQSGEFRQLLKKELSPYMLPSRIEFLQLPLNANGKIDRQKLKTML